VALVVGLLDWRSRKAAKVVADTGA